jgi:hypothetical protein
VTHFVKIEEKGKEIRKHFANRQLPQPNTIMNKLILFVLVIVSLHMACNADESTINLRKNDQILSDTLPETVIETTPESTSMPTFKFSDLFTEDEKSCVEECQDVSIIGAYSLLLTLTHSYSLTDSLTNSFIAPPQTVTEQDVSAYLGRWYQMYASFGAVKTYEKNLFCITADYTLSEQYPGSFEILNQVNYQYGNTFYSYLNLLHC